MDTPDQIALSILEQRNEWLVNGVLKPATLGVLIADAIRAERKQVEQVTADAALVAELSALQAELLAAKEDNAALLTALREIIYNRGALPAHLHSLLDRIQAAEHPGRALMAAMTRRMSAMKVELEAAKAREQILLAAAEQAWRALLERTPHSVPGGEEACEALHAAIVKVIANKARGEPQ